MNIRSLMCDYLGLSSQTQAFATQDANVCNPGCKRLHPGSQTFISIGIGLYLTLNLCPLELTKMISRVKICTPKTQKSPSREVLEQEEAPFIDEIPAQKGLNVQ